ncbi:MAG TPA: hypothetical protein VFH50_03425 [Acidimicrobiales bacterium]|nr:hypothetical protein [Acidimicrobiales bacterium]
MRALSALGRFLYEFVVGDDWTIAAGVVVALAITYGLAHSGVTVWWLLPLVVAGGLSASLVRATRRSER